MDIKEFVLNKHRELESIGNKFIHRWSARGGTLYISPDIWNLLITIILIVVLVQLIQILGQTISKKIDKRRKAK
jgi:hypothetical protein